MQPTRDIKMIRQQIISVYEDDFLVRFLINQFFEQMEQDEDTLLVNLFDLLFELQMEIRNAEYDEEYEYCQKVKYVQDRVVQQFDKMYMESDNPDYKIINRIDTANTAKIKIDEIIREYDKRND